MAGTFARVNARAASSVNTATNLAPSIGVRVLEDLAKPVSPLRRVIACIPQAEPVKGDVIRQGQVADQPGRKAKSHVIAALPFAKVWQPAHVGVDAMREIIARARPRDSGAWKRWLWWR